jgi:outer membrane protein assembly factor BamB
VARFALALLLVAACGVQSTPPPKVAASASVAASVVWKSESTVDFSNHLVGDLELMAGSLVTLTGEGTTVTGTQIVAIDPVSGRTRWADATLNSLVPAGPSSFHQAHFLRDGDDLIALVTDGTSGKSAVIRFSVPQRRLVWQFAVKQTLFPESLAVHNSLTCFAGQEPGPPLALSVTCLDRNGRSLWTRKVEQNGSSGSGTEIEIAASKLMVLVPTEGDPGHALASVLDLQTGASTVAPFQVNALFRGMATKHLTIWKEDKVAAFLTDGIAVFDLSSAHRLRLIPLVGQFPRVPEIAVGGSTAYVFYDLPYPKGGDQPKADVAAAFDLESGRKLWEMVDLADPNLARLRPMRLQGSELLYGDNNGGVWVLAASTGSVQRHFVPQDPLFVLDTVAPLSNGSSVIVSENFGPGPLDYRLAAIQ